MQITTSDKTIQIRYGNHIFTHPVNSIAYAVGENKDSITLFRNNEPIATSPLKGITVDGVSLTKDNVENLLGKLFV
ncbi:MAG TPA: hypothetical protein DIT04_10825 [Dysgonomonas sp.]|nr:hypothetical protein [Dysgonomonas sp.]